VPRLWTDTIDEHRRAVRDATLDAAEALVAERGLLAVTMSQIAERAGIGRATLYKYFPDVDAVLVAWHERQVAAHLETLMAIGGREAPAIERLEAVLEAYALLSHGRHGNELAALLHRTDHVARAHARLAGFIEELVREAAASGDVRSDVPAAELASYCLHALAGSSRLRSKPAVGRLVKVTLAGLREAAGG
jgi:AcrR family transcriptional regulator